jgi:nickel transport protein
VGARGGHAADESAAVSSTDSPSPGVSTSESATDCRELQKLLEQQRVQLARELGQIKREMGLLREELGTPGLKEVFAGVGYILGLAGIGLYVHSRKTSTSR